MHLCHYERRGFLKNIDKQAKVHDLEKQIDPVRWLLSNGVDQMVYKLYGLSACEHAQAGARGECSCGGEINWNDLPYLL